MKSVPLILLFLFCPVYFVAASSLSGGPFNVCLHSYSPGRMDLDYFVEFMPNGKEIEVEIYYGTRDIPCSGEPLFTIARSWSYKDSGFEFESTLKKVVVLVSSEKMITFFNEQNFCEHRKWKLETPVACDGKNIFGKESLIGTKTTHLYGRRKDTLFILQDGDQPLVFKKLGRPEERLR